MKKYPERKTDPIGCIVTPIIGFSMLFGFISGVSRCSCTSSNQTYIPESKPGEMIMCPDCKGSGYEDVLHTKNYCRRCKGEGRIEKR